MKFDGSFTAKGFFKIENDKGEVLCDNKNLCLDNFSKLFANMSGYGSYYEQPFLGNYIWNGGYATSCYIGDGNVEPSSSDTALTHQLWGITCSKAVSLIHDDFKGASITMTFVFPENSSYVGVMREICLKTGGSSGTSFLLTKSLLKDSEGNPYEINKTDLDQITVTYTVDISFSSFFFTNYFMKYNSENSSSFSALSSSPGKLASMGLSDSLRPIFVHDNRFFYQGNNKNPFYLDGVAANRETKLATFNKKRIESSVDFNGHYLMSAYAAGGAGIIRFPNTDYFPQSSLENYSVGTGDGQTKEFVPPIPCWDEGTEEIYIDGVLQVRDVDYTCDHRHNCQKLAELMPMHHAVMISGYEGTGSPNHYSNIYTATRENIGNSDYHISLYSCFMNKSGQVKYLYLSSQKDDFQFVFMLPIEESALDWSVSDIFVRISSYVSSSDKPFSIEVSDDLETWETILDHQVANTSSRDLYYNSMSDLVDFELEEPVIKKYWRVTIHKNLQGYGMVLILDKKHKGIKFVNPPSKGALITMNAKTSLIYKDENHVIDMVGSIQV